MSDGVTGGPELPLALGRYRPVGVLGAGGMGTVYKAHDPIIDRMVAVKVVRTDVLDAATRAEFLERFRTEAQAAGRCMHPAIVAVYDFSGEAGDPFIVMELVDGKSLQQVLQDAAARASLAVVPVLLQVLGGLAYAHRLGITHRDIKPANIIVTELGHAKIADFGIARLSGTALATGGLTAAGSLLGTPNYMAPEQVRGEEVDQRADLFAVGAILYQALTGRPPFAGRNTSDTIQRLTGPEPASMVAVEAADRGGFVPVLQRALAKSPAQRFRSADEFATALQVAGRQPAAAMPGFDDDQPTVILGAALPAQASGRAQTVAPAQTIGPSLTTGGGRWDPAMLQRVERALAQFAGPMARVMVNQSARQAGSADELYQLLARNLQNAADRSAFLRALGGARVEPTLAAPSRGGQTLAPVTAPGVIGPIPADALAAAQAALAFYVGPIARMLVRQAAAQAASRKDFLDRLCAHVTRPDEATALRRRLRAEVEPKLP